jgi:hypothetical protein
MNPKLYLATDGRVSMMTFNWENASDFAHKYDGAAVTSVSSWDEMKLLMGFLTPEQNEKLLVERTVVYYPNTQGVM